MKIIFVFLPPSASRIQNRIISSLLSPKQWLQFTPLKPCSAKEAVLSEWGVEEKGKIKTKQTRVGRKSDHSIHWIIYREKKWLEREGPAQCVNKVENRGLIDRLGTGIWGGVDEGEGISLPHPLSPSVDSLAFCTHSPYRPSFSSPRPLQPVTPQQQSSHRKGYEF